MQLVWAFQYIHVFNENERNNLVTFLQSVQKF